MENYTLLEELLQIGQDTLVLSKSTDQYYWVNYKESKKSKFYKTLNEAKKNYGEDKIKWIKF